MERTDRPPAVRGLRPETNAERQHARILHALHSTRAHLHACRAALDQAYESMAEARHDAERLSVTQGAEAYAEILMRAEATWALVSGLHRDTHTDSLDVAADVSDLMERIREVARAQGWA